MKNNLRKSGKHGFPVLVEMAYGGEHGKTKRKGGKNECTRQTDTLPGLKNMVYIYAVKTNKITA